MSKLRTTERIQKLDSQSFNLWLALNNASDYRARTCTPLLQATWRNRCCVCRLL